MDGSITPAALAAILALPMPHPLQALLRLQKKKLLWAEWLQQEVLASVPHRHVVLTMPRLLRGIFRKRRDLLGDLAQCSAEALSEYLRRQLGANTRPGIVVSLATSGDLRHFSGTGTVSSLKSCPMPGIEIKRLQQFSAMGFWSSCASFLMSDLSRFS